MSIIHLKSENNLRQVISNNNVLVIIDCYADWCGPCKLLDKHLKQMIDIWKNLYKDSIEICKLNVDDSNFSKFVKINNIQTLPTVLFVRGDDVVDKVIGYNIKKINETVENIMNKKINRLI